MFYILNLCEIIYWFIRVVPFNYSPHTDHMLYIKKHMSDYLCVWSTQAFPTWAGPGAILISQSRVGITFGFPPQSSKPQKIPTDMCPHVPLRSVTSLHVCCLPCSMLIWIPGVCYFFIFLKTINAFVNLIYRIPVLKLVHGSFFTLFFLYIWGSCPCSAASCSLRNLPFPRCHFSAVVARELSDSFHPHHFKNLFS